MKPGRIKTEKVRRLESSRFVDEFSSSCIQPGRLKASSARKAGHSVLYQMRQEVYWQPTAATERNKGCRSWMCNYNELLQKCRRPPTSRSDIGDKREHRTGNNPFTGECTKHILWRQPRSAKSNSLYILKRKQKGKRARNQVFIEYNLSLVLHAERWRAWRGLGVVC
jgi:hypothetical protein